MFFFKSSKYFKETFKSSEYPFELMVKGLYEVFAEDFKKFPPGVSWFGDVTEALKVLKHAGMLEVKWRMPSEPQGKPEKEYHVSYTHLSASIYSPLKDLNTILEIVSMPDDEFDEIVEKIIAEIDAGRKSVPYISKSLGLDPLYIRSVAKRSLKLTLKGQLVELAKDEEL